MRYSPSSPWRMKIYLWTPLPWSYWALAIYFYTIYIDNALMQLMKCLTKGGGHQKGVSEVEGGHTPFVK